MFVCLFFTFKLKVSIKLQSFLVQIELSKLNCPMQTVQCQTVKVCGWSILGYSWLFLAILEFYLINMQLNLSISWLTFLFFDLHLFFLRCIKIYDILITFFYHHLMIFSEWRVLSAFCHFMMSLINDETIQKWAQNLSIDSGKPNDFEIAFQVCSFRSF